MSTQVVDFLDRAIKASAIHAVIAKVTNTNAPMAVALTATTEEALKPLIDYLYKAIIGEKMPSVYDNNGSKITVRQLITYCVLTGASGYVSAKVAEKLGYRVNIAPYLLVAQSAGSIYICTKWALSSVPLMQSRIVRLLQG